jgi:polygalacturonase
MSKVTANSVIKDLNIINYPVHCFSISSCSNVIIDNINLDNSAGNAPNNVSNGLPAGHNSDGFDLSSCTNFLLTNSFVNNQDDCVAVTSGNNVTVSNMWCKGGHGMSIGSVGGKSNNNVTNIVYVFPKVHYFKLRLICCHYSFKDSQIIDSTNGPRIKSNYNTTGFISNITYSNILVSNIETYGIDVQQDYLNGGPTGTPTNGVIISNLLFSNVTGTAVTGAQDYYILCGNGSCSNFVFDNVNIVGGSIPASCNYPSTGCPGV